MSKNDDLRSKSAEELNKDLRRQVARVRTFMNQKSKASGK
jgi:ribosomal protein L29